MWSGCRSNAARTKKELSAMTLARQYPPERMRIVQEGFEKEDLPAA
jgi:hypothetical protein